MTAIRKWWWPQRKPKPPPDELKLHVGPLIARMIAERILDGDLPRPCCLLCDGDLDGFPATIATFRPVGESEELVFALCCVCAVLPADELKLQVISRAGSFA
jgi:hypothetical protein